MNDFTFDFNQLLNLQVELALMQHQEVKPIVLLLKKYGIAGTQMLSFLAELATVCQQLKPPGESE